MCEEKAVLLHQGMLSIQPGRFFMFGVEPGRRQRGRALRPREQNNGDN